MKIRTGFVSNSSSSSFIVKGFVIDTNKFDEKRFHEFIINKFPDLAEKWKNYDEDQIRWNTFYDLMDKGLFITDSEEDGAPKGKTIIGELLQDTGEGDYFKDMIIDLELNEILKEIKNILHDDKLQPKVIVGTRCT